MLTLKRSGIWKGIHWLIIANFVVQIVYTGAMVFFVVTPEGTTGPLFGQASTMPFELMVTRRLYASESWIAIAGLSIYLAITEIAPRAERIRDK